MSRYIDADKLLNRMKRDPLFSIVERYGVSGVIEAEPTADVQEVKHGKWKQKAWVDEEMEVREDVLVTKCSECGMRTYWLKGEKLWNFCPNCGADMRGKCSYDVKPVMAKTDTKGE